MNDITAQIFALLIAISIISAMIDEEHFFKTLHAMHGDPERRERLARAVRPHFHLVRYFTVVGLFTIGVVALTLIYFERAQLELVSTARSAQSAERASEVAALEKNQQTRTRALLLSEREARHRTVAQLLIPALGEQALSALVEQARPLPVESCRSIAADQAAARLDCQHELKSRLRALPAHAALSARFAEMLSSAGVSDLQLIDQRGLILLSMNPVRAGDDLGPQAQILQLAQGGATPGAPDSSVHQEGAPAEMILRTRLAHALPGQVPVLFELASALAGEGQGASASAGTGALAAAEASGLEAEMARSSKLLLIAVTALMVILFGVLFMLVRRADRFGREREKALAETEEKLAVTTLIANSSHLDPALASEIRLGLSAALRQIQTVQLALLKALPALRVSSAVSRVIMAAKGEQLVFNLQKAQKQFSQLAGSDADVQGLNPLLESAQLKISQIAEMIEAEPPRQPTAPGD